MKLLAVDANSVLNRAFYGIKPLTNKDGVPTNAIYGFLTILLKLLEDLHPDGAVFAFDLKAPTFRHQADSRYKANRKGMPEDLAQQIPLIKELLCDLGYQVVGCEGYEADDILGTFARICGEEGSDCVIATGDRDSLQLIDSHVTVRLATTKMGAPDATLYDWDAIVEKYGVTPPELIEVKALMGDASDNIPGVPGIGEKTALSLIAQFHTIDSLYDALEKGEEAAASIKPGVRQKLLDGKDSAYNSRFLAQIVKDAPVDACLDRYRIDPSKGDSGAAYALMSRLELFRLIDRMGLKPGEAAPAPGREETAPSLPTRAEAAAHLPSGEGECLDILFWWRPEAAADALPDAAAWTQEGRVLLSRAGWDGFEEGVKGLLAGSRPLRTTQAKRIHRYALSQGIEAEGICFDAELAGYLLSPNASSYGLEELAGSYGVSLPALELPEQLTAPACPDGEEQLSLEPAGKKGEEAPHPLEKLAGQAAAFPRLADLMTQRLEEYGQMKLLREIELPLAQVLSSMEQEGVELDCQGLAAFGRQLDGDIAQLQEEIYRQSGCPFNINSPKQLGEVLFVRLGLPAKKKTKSGYSTNADVLEGLRPYHPIVDMVLEYRKLTKLKSTYVEGLLKVVEPDGRIHTTFIQTETRTGRISSVEPNMQNIPVRTELGSQMRAFFRAKAGCELADADYSQIELRVLAHIADDKAMQQAFTDGTDIHTQTASQVFGVPLEFVTPQMRSSAKAVNFGIVYGIGAFSLAGDIGVSIAEADRYIKNYLNTFSGVKHYMENCVAQAKEAGFVTTLSGRRRYLPELSSSNRITKAFGERVAMNTPIQGTAADIIKIAMIRVYRRLKAEGMASRLILQVHDELIVEAPEAEVEQAKRVLKEEMEAAMALKVPLRVDVSAGKTWLDSKG